jgi:TrwC relaxase
MVLDSVTDAMNEIENRMEVKVRKGGAKGIRVSDNLVYATFIHRETRPLDGICGDPHFHLHVFCGNASFDEVEQQWKTLEV